MDYLLVKTLHILSATLLFGTGLGSVFYKWRADKSADLPAIAVTNKNVVLADWLFTTPTVILQPVTGVWMALSAGYPLTSSWLVLSIVLYIIAGLCWLPVVYIQILMRDISRSARRLVLAAGGGSANQDARPGVLRTALHITFAG